MDGGNGSTPGQGTIPDLSRVTFFDGQRLEAGDLNDEATVQRELRWLHNRSLHNWGIALGYAVTGAKGDHQVTIRPGYATDCLGREVLLTETIQKPVPARADDGNGKPVIYYLVAAYPDEATLAVLERRDGDCGAGGAVRLQERAAIYWKAQGEATVEGGREIVLAQATVLNCQLAAPLSTSQRRSARPPQQPRVAAGRTPKGGTPWTLWRQGDDPAGPVIGVRTAVDTSAERFGTTPEYQARLEGPRLFEPGTAGASGSAYLLDGVVTVNDPARDRFTFGVLLPRGLTDPLGNVPINPGFLFDPPDVLLKAVVAAWSVVWLGVEG